VLILTFSLLGVPIATTEEFGKRFSIIGKSIEFGVNYLEFYRPAAVDRIDRKGKAKVAFYFFISYSTGRFF